MNEIFLCHIWDYQIFNHKNLKTRSNKSLSIIFPGKKNNNTGPDYTDAVVNIDGIEWHGKIEVHVLSSDWERHNHQNNIQYNNVVLHVVWKDDKEIRRSCGGTLDVLELEAIVDLELARKSFFSSQDKGKIPCSSLVKNISSEIINSQIKISAQQRLESKAERIKDYFQESNENLEETLYLATAFSFGLKVNSEAFLKLSKILKLSSLKKCKNTIERESLLFGVSGLLPMNSEDEYIVKLLKTYDELLKKFNIQEKMESREWLFHRLRPSGFPTLRIAFFAEFVSYLEEIYLQIIENKITKETLQKVFDKIQLASFWNTHYTFLKSVEQTNFPGLEFINLVIINGIVPFIFFLGKIKKLDSFSDKAIGLLSSLPSEKNIVIKNLADLQIVPDSAFSSQGMIELYNNFCTQKRCLDCKIGMAILGKG